VGETVMEYVKKRKLTLAGRQLLETDKAIINIAMEYGFQFAPAI
jgi:AraC family transcriptional regulator